MLLPYAIGQTAFPFLAGRLVAPSLLPALPDQAGASFLLPFEPPELEEGQRMIIEEVLRIVLGLGARQPLIIPTSPAPPRRGAFSRLAWHWRRRKIVSDG